MERIYSMCCVMMKDGTQNQIIGNNVQRFYDGNGNEISAVGGTFFDNLLQDLTYEEGVVLVKARIEAQPFDGYTHEAWVYGAKTNARISCKEPYFSRRRCRDGHRNFFACGDWWLNSWCDHEFFPERNEGILKVYIKVERTDKTSETDYDEYFSYRKAMEE